MDVQAGKPGRRWVLAGLCGVCAYLLFGLLYLFAGQHNVDEGWYLYAGKLVMAGKLPYRDFGFAQMPLMPYVYGLVQALGGPSLYLGRATSVVFSTTAALICTLGARRYAGDRAAAITALMLATFTFGIYFNSIVKIYALLSLLFAGTLLALSSRMPEQLRLPLAVLLAGLAALTRLTAVFFALPILAYALGAPRATRTRLLVMAVCLILIGGAALVFGSDVALAKWNLLDQHMERWGTGGPVHRAEQIGLRLFKLGRISSPVAFLLVVGAYLGGWRRSRDYLMRHGELAAYGAGAVLFILAHIPAGGAHSEYYVPGLVALTPLAAISWSKGWGRCISDRSSRRWLIIAAVLPMLAMLGGHNRLHLDRTGGRLPVDEINQVASVVAASSAPTDQVFALEGIPVVVLAGRSLPEGMSMAQFSYQDVSDEQARRLRVVNHHLILEQLRRRLAPLVVLTDYDWKMFERSGVYSDRPADVSAIRRALDQGYRLVFSMSSFGQVSDTICIYRRIG